MSEIATSPRRGVRVLLSTGLGRLHFVPAAQSLAAEGVELEVMQGWVPRYIPSWGLRFLGKALRAPGLQFGLAQRRLAFLPRSRNHASGQTEAAAFLLRQAGRLGILPPAEATARGWRMFGRATRSRISTQEVFHVRSGAGRGGAIAKARKQGLRVLVDHSIAHPAFIEATLKDEYAKWGIPLAITTSSPFWQGVVRDCEDADLLVVNSDFVKRTFADYGYDPARIAVSYLGVRTDFAALKQTYEPAKDELLLLFTGQFSVRKGAPYLLAAIAELRRRGVPVRLRVVGGTSEARQFIRGNAPPANVDLLGHVPQDQLKAHLAAADMYVFPSLAEGCASSGMEAMAAGLPIIATAESGLPLRHGENGWVIEPKSVAAICAAVEALAQDHALRASVGRRASADIAEDYTWAKYAQCMDQLYRGLAHRGP